MCGQRAGQQNSGCGCRISHRVVLLALFDGAQIIPEVAIVDREGSDEVEFSPSQSRMSPRDLFYSLGRSICVGKANWRDFGIPCGGAMRTFTAVIERDQETQLFVGYIPGWPGAHSQGETLDELRVNLREVVDLLLEDGEPDLEAEFVGTQTLDVA